jgi:hypothetical protein
MDDLLVRKRLFTRLKRVCGEFLRWATKLNPESQKISKFRVTASPNPWRVWHLLAWIHESGYWESRMEK